MGRWGGVTLRCASFLFGHWIIPFLSILVVQIGTVKCVYCPQKDEPVVPWDSLFPDDQTFLRDKYPDAELHTHPAHTEMQLGSPCAFIFFWLALFANGKPNFLSKKSDKI